MKLRKLGLSGATALALVTAAGSASAQLKDITQITSNAPGGAIPAGGAINKSFTQQIGAGRGDTVTADSSIFIIKRDPFRAIRRGRQIFQRKFQVAQGFGPLTNDGVGNVSLVGGDRSAAAGLVDSCAGCHGRPRGSAGHGGDVVTRPDSRDAPHLFGLGLQEQLGDEITSALRALRDQAATEAQDTAVATAAPASASRLLRAKGVSYGTIVANSDADGNVTFDTSGVVGVNPDLRVRPFFAEGTTISIREFLVGAFNAEMGLEAPDPDLVLASSGGLVQTPSGMVLNGGTDAIEGPPVISPSQDGDTDGKTNEIPTSIVDFMEFYLLNYFKAGTSELTPNVMAGRTIFTTIGCATCHVAQMTITHDRRVADLETTFSPTMGNPFNRLFAAPMVRTINGLTGTPDGTGLPNLKLPEQKSFVVRNFFADLKRHNLGANFDERNYEGTFQTDFITEPLWGAGTTAPYGHDGRSPSLEDVILRHGTSNAAFPSEAAAQATSFAALSRASKDMLLAFLDSLVLFPPDDTASGLQMQNPAAVHYPQNGHGAIALTPIFNDPTNLE